MRLTRLAVAACVLGLAACGGSSSGEPAADAARTEPAELAVDTAGTEPAVAVEPAAEESEELEEPAVETGTAEPVDAAPADQGAELDPAELEPGTAVVRIDGRDLRFSRGDSIFDVCATYPDQAGAEVKMDLIGGPEEGSPHFILHQEDPKLVMVVAFLPDTGFIVGRGEETDPYFEHFGIVAPLMPPAQIEGDLISGTTPMVNVFTEEELQAEYAVRCR